mmetsp:Transcript_34117/g.77050  ORF Transcript_34117/g.77050 Transcript_34117/m.77050 type:complete len:230 (-) Transcript_34117:20-709(-)
MVGVPRFNARLAQAIEALGGVEYLILPSKGLESGHIAWRTRFPDLVRVIHRHDLGPLTMTSQSGPTAEPEQVLQGAGPWELEAGGEQADDDGSGGGMVRIVHTPGHTFGSLSVWYEGASVGPATGQVEAVGREAALFTGATLGVGKLKPGALDSNEGGALDPRLGRNAAGIPRHSASLRKLADPEVVPDWQWLLPAYGPRRRFESAEEMRREVLEVADKAATDHRGPLY